MPPFSTLLTSYAHPSENADDALVRAEIGALIRALDAIDLTELDAYRLLDRTDTKFLLRDWQLLAILQAVGHRYRVLAATADRINRYRTLYFDTQDLGFYQQHHNDHQDRYKVRCREYVDSGLNFVEVKHKINRQRTIKQRLRTATFYTQLTGEARDFVAAHVPIDVDQLEPTLLNEFSRITLVSKNRPERLTIDIDYRHEWGGRNGALPGFVIAEVKQPKFDLASDFVQGLRALGVRPGGFSKYCTAVVDLYPYVKYNRFKRRFLQLQRLRTQEPERGPLALESANNQPDSSQRGNQ